MWIVERVNNLFSQVNLVTEETEKFWIKVLKLRGFVVE